MIIATLIDIGFPVTFICCSFVLAVILLSNPPEEYHPVIAFAILSVALFISRLIFQSTSFLSNFVTYFIYVSTIIRFTIEHGFKEIDRVFDENLNIKSSITPLLLDILIFIIIIVILSVIQL